MSGFTTEGYDSFPNLYQDGQWLSDLGAMVMRDDSLEYLVSREVLEARVMQYGAFLQRPDLMPRAERTANRNMDHFLFELAYRDGVYEADMARLEDETCETA